MTANANGVSSGVDENVLELASGDGCTNPCTSFGFFLIIQLFSLIP